MITKELILSMFRVDPDAGEMYWITGPRTHPRLAGQRAGCARANENGKYYWHIKIRGIPYKRAHLIFCITHGHFPLPCVDHIDGDSMNDRPHNLRSATVTQNNWNHKSHARRIRLPMGVRNTASGRFQARITYLGTQIHLGAYDTVSQAESVYRSKRSELYGDFA